MQTKLTAGKEQQVNNQILTENYKFGPGKVVQAGRVIEVYTELEQMLVLDPEWLAGGLYKTERSRRFPGENIFFHTADVLGNIKELNLSIEIVSKLRLAALVHDSFKYQTKSNQLNKNQKNHAWLARDYLSRFTNDKSLLYLVAYHDYAKILYFNYLGALSRRDEQRVQAKINSFLDELNLRGILELYIKFFYCDTNVDRKTQDPYDWFISQVEEIFPVESVG